MALPVKGDLFGTGGGFANLQEGFDSLVLHVKTLKKISIGMIVVIVMAGIFSNVSMLEVKKALTNTRAEKISSIKNKDGDCKFTLRAEWSPVKRDTEFRLMYNAGGEIGTPTVTRSPWQIERTLPCKSRIVVQVVQVVRSGNEVACKIMANRVTMDEEHNSRSRVTKCVA